MTTVCAVQWSGASSTIVLHATTWAHQSGVCTLSNTSSLWSTGGKYLLPTSSQLSLNKYCQNEERQAPTINSHCRQLTSRTAERETAWRTALSLCGEKNRLNSRLQNPVHSRLLSPLHSRLHDSLRSSSTSIDGRSVAKQKQLASIAAAFWSV